MVTWHSTRWPCFFFKYPNFGIPLANFLNSRMDYELEMTQCHYSRVALNQHNNRINALCWLQKRSKFRLRMLFHKSAYINRTLYKNVIRTTKNWNVIRFTGHIVRLTRMHAQTLGSRGGCACCACGMSHANARPLATHAHVFKHSAHTRMMTQSHGFCGTLELALHLVITNGK